MMRRIAILAVAAPIALAAIAANAQLSPLPPAPQRTFPPPLAPSTEQGRSQIQAPVGHRQPRAGDVPNEGDVSRNDADVELDRKLNICRGC
jgi:hypothetical protein